MTGLVMFGKVALAIVTLGAIYAGEHLVFWKISEKRRRA